MNISTISFGLTDHLKKYSPVSTELKNSSATERGINKV